MAGTHSSASCCAWRWVCYCSQTRRRRGHYRSSKQPGFASLIQLQSTYQVSSLKPTHAFPQEQPCVISQSQYIIWLSVRKVACTLQCNPLILGINWKLQLIQCKEKQPLHSPPEVNVLALEHAVLFSVTIICISPVKARPENHHRRKHKGLHLPWT